MPLSKKETWKELKIDMPELIARKSARTLWGQGINLSSENETLNDFLKQLLIRSKLDSILYANEKLLSKHGRSIITIDKTKGGEYRFTIANPFITSKVGRVFVDEVSAVIYKKVTQDDKMFWIKEVWDTEKVVREVWLDEDGKQTTSVMGYNSAVPEHLQIERVWKHGLGVLPVVEFHNLPDFSFDYLWNGYNPDDKAVAGLKPAINNTIVQMQKEMVLNRTRVIGSLTPEKMAEMKLEAQGEMKILLDDFIVQTNAVGVDGADVIEVMVGNPQLKTYWDALLNQVEFYFNACGYEWDKGETAGSQTATGVMLGKGRDVETNKEKRRQRTIDCNKLIDRVLQSAGLMKDALAEREYTFEIKENINIDEMNRANKLAIEVENGFRTRLSAISITNGMTNKEEAKNLKEEIDKEQQEDIDRMQTEEEGYSVSGESGEKISEKSLYKALAFAKAKGFDTKTLEKGKGKTKTKEEVE